MICKVKLQATFFCFLFFFFLVTFKPHCNISTCFIIAISETETKTDQITCGTKNSLTDNSCKYQMLFLP